MNKLRKGDNKYYGLVRILANSDFLKYCYLEIKSKPGNMTPGSERTTLDGISEKWFTETAGAIKTGKYRFPPGRKVLIPKQGKTERRPLGVGGPRSKIVQKALTMILQVIWEPRFSNSSYGYRPGRSLHKALQEIYRNGSSYKWVIQGDISKCFDRIPHRVILEEVGEYIKCEKTTQLIRKFLKAGHMDIETGKRVTTNMGTPQGGVLSPLISNIVLGRLDSRMDKIKQKFDRGDKRKRNPEYDRLTSKINNLRKFQPGSPELPLTVRRRRATPSVDTHDPNFKRMLYLRYADDFIVLVTGTSDEANHIRNQIADTLKKKCGLELNRSKTLITAVKDGFNFLGAFCRKVPSTKAGLFTNHHGNPAKYRMRMRVEAPIEKLLLVLRENKFVKLNRSGEPTPTARKDMVNLEHHEIVTYYNHRIQGLLSFYSFAANFNRLGSVVSMLNLSCALTLMLKFKLGTKRQVYVKFGRLLEDPETGVKLNIPKDFKVKHKYEKKEINRPEESLGASWFNKITRSSLNKSCAICKSRIKVEMHHIRKVKDVRHKMRTGDSTYQQWVGVYLRKQVPLCSYHHDLLHGGDLNSSDLNQISRYS